MIQRGARFAISGAIFAADRASKFWIEQNLTAFDSLTVIPGVCNIVHTQNRGAAFGFLNQADGPLRAFLLIGLSSAILVYVAVQLWRMPKQMWPQHSLAAAALALVFGGASGNLYDRFVRGSVTDFLQVFIGSYEWPSFNVADSAISIGACLLFFTLWKAHPQPGS
ncbi:MAG: signal peptidase II [Bryobacterales bacterium]|nr:signal peptidase II [Bryobacterales bacterium]